MVYGGYRVVREVEAAPQKPRWGQEAYKCSGRLQWGRCWDTERGLAEKIAHGMPQRHSATRIPAKRLSMRQHASTLSGEL